MGVVKANCYGHGLKAIEPILKAGCNYLAVATLEEAIKVRERYTDIPILCLGVIYLKDLEVCLKYDITITVNSKDYFDSIKELNLPLKVHLKLNTGMNRLGVKNTDDVDYIVSNMVNTNYILEGIYTHIFNPSDQDDTNEQLNKFYNLCHNIDLSKIKIVHVAASETLTNYPKPDFINGVRLGIIMYGFSRNIELKSTFSLYSNIVQINDVNNREKVGYNGAYIPTTNEKIGVVQIGYADGIIRAYKDSYVYINNKEYKIVGNICMDMLFVKIDDNVKVTDEVVILKDNEHIIKTAQYLHTIPYEILCSISYRVPRIYID